MSLAGAAAPAWLVYTLCCVGAVALLPQLAEHELHLALAELYRAGVWDLWDPRWGGGVAAIAHPPAVHQWAGWSGKLVGLEWAYAGWLVLAGWSWVGAAGAWALSLGARKGAASAAAMMAAVMPALYHLLFPLGQLPFVLSVGLGGLAGAAGLRAAQGGARGWWVAAVGWALAALACHPGASLVLLLALWPMARSDLRVTVSIAGAVAAGAALTLWPFVRVMMSARSVELEKVELAGTWIALGWVVGLAALGALPWAPGHRALAAAALGTAVFAALEMLVGWKLLAGDKLVLLGGGLGAVAWGCSPESPRAALRWAKRAWLALGVVGCAWGLGSPPMEVARLHRRATTEAAAVIARAPGPYLTWGLGPERLELLRRVPAAPLADVVLPYVHVGGGLDATSYASWDATPASFTGWSAQLQVVRWVITAAPGLEAVLRGAGFRERQAWAGNVTLWEQSAAIAQSFGEVAAVKQRPSLVMRWAWLLLPSLGLVSGCVGCARALRPTFGGGASPPP